MADDIAYLGSTAFNQSALMQESVSPNTGALTVALEIIHLPGVSDGIGLTLDLSYALGVSGILGLPDSWTFSLPYVVPGASLTTSGQTYIIDPLWQDVTGYMSGLRYQNNHGVLFQSVSPPQPSPSGTGEYSYQYNYADGSRDYFDATGKLIEHDDLFGNSVVYAYTDELAGVYGNQLATITDSYGQVVSFAYDPGVISLSLPNGGVVTITLGLNGVDNMKAELGAVTSYTYGEQAGATVLTGVSYPTGLSTQIEYTSIGYATPEGDAAFPAVSALSRYDGQDFVSRMRYQYGGLTQNNTYTGYTIGCVLTPSNDGLMDSNKTTYLYDVTLSVMDEADALVAYSEYFYNYLHMLTVKNDYLIADGGALQPCFQTSYVYESTQDAHARTTNYSKPITAVSAAWEDNLSDYAPHSRSTFSYDLFGNPLSTQSAMYDEAAQDFAIQSSSQFTYVETGWGGEMPLSSTVLDAVTSASHTSSYTLTADERCVAQTVQTRREPGGSVDLPWKTRTAIYDAQGRPIEQTLAWSENAPNPDPKLTASTTRFSYSYDGSAHALTMGSADALGHVSTKVIRTDYPNGVIVEATTPLGSVSHFDYDLLGRLTTSTDPLGHVSTLSYACMQRDGCNRVRNTTTDGYVVDLYSDGLGRQTRTLDGPGGGDPSRVLHELSYGPLGQPVRSVGTLGLATTFAYDALSRLVSTTDPHGNCATTAFSDEQRTTTTALNGVIRSRMIADNMARIVRSTTLADPSDSSVDYSVEASTDYNGLGSPIRRSMASVPLAGGSSTMLSLQTTSYDPDGRTCRDQYTGYAAAADSATREVARDLLGDVVSYTKTVCYGDGGTYDWRSETSAYDGNGDLVSRTNAAGQTETHAYNANRRVVSTTRYDGVQIVSAYDANSNLVSVTCGEDVRTYAYDIENRLVRLSRAGDDIRYSYEIDGSPRQTTYPDRSSLTYTRDGYGRVTSVTDYAGDVTTMVYGLVGEITSKTSCGCTLAFDYATVNGARDMLVGYTLSGSASGTVATGFDGFGRESKGTATLGGTALSLAYSHDALGRTVSLATDGPSGTTTTTYAFDGLNQVVAQIAHGAQPQASRYAYDGNTNVLSATRDDVTTEYRYNAIDQLVGEGVSYDTNGRMTTDGAGAIYSYDGFDRLLGVSSPAGATRYAYYPDGLLASAATSQGGRSFFYVEGTATQVRAGALGAEQWTHYLFSGKDRVAAFAGGDAQALFMAANGSVGAEVTGDTASVMSYAAYGEAGGAPPDFAWKQEYRDPDQGLVYLRTRFYHPGLMRFLSMDAFGSSNRYAIADGDPINGADPTGLLSEAAALGIGIGVGVVATLVTGGALGAVVGTDMVASIAVGAVSGAAGSVAGDGTTAALSGQSFTAQRAGIDLLAGAVGGGVGAGVGGAAGRGCMALALRGGLSRGAITAMGATTAGLGGGLAGAAASSGVTSAFYGQPFFSSATALNMVVGGVAGLGGGLLASGAHFGFGRPGGSGIGVMPTEADVNANFQLGPPFSQGPGTGRVLDFSASDGDVLRGMINNSQGTYDNLTGNGARDAIVIHGAPRHLFPEVDIRGTNYTQYMKPEAFADLLRNNYGIVPGGRDINLFSCYAAKLRLASVAQRLATQLGVNVYAPACRDTVTINYARNWIRYAP